MAAARVKRPSPEGRVLRVGEQRTGGEVEQPRADRAAATRDARRRVGAGSERGQDRPQPLDHRLLAADHPAVAARLARDAAAGADVDIVMTGGGEIAGPADVVLAARITAVDDDVTS